MEPVYFATPAELRAWFEQHHETVDELIVGYLKRATGRPSITWSESVDQALCFGWIDGIRRRVDDERYQIRFTPRRPGSIWSAVNIAKVAELTERGLMRPAGLRAFESRRDDRSAIYTYEQRQTAKLDPAQLDRLRANPQAWAWFSAQPPWYRRAATHWVVSAKREQTRDSRLTKLIEASMAGRTVPPLSRPTGGGATDGGSTDGG
jgi:uncharacterized protein YdeI (YjbR/CyaY-like superfamily)